MIEIIDDTAQPHHLLSKEHFYADPIAGATTSIEEVVRKAIAVADRVTSELPTAKLNSRGRLNSFQDQVVPVGLRPCIQQVVQGA